MAFRALPPDFCMAARRHIARRQILIQRRMPFGRDQWKSGVQIVESPQQLSACAIRALGALFRPAENQCAPLMALIAPPPGIAIAVWRNLVRTKRTVFFAVPLCGNLREVRRKVIHAGNDLLAGADRATAVFSGSCRNHGPPFMAVGTLPPDLFRTAGSDIFRRQSLILRRMPLGSQLRACGCKIIFSQQHDLVGADRTACTFRARLHDSLPFMAAAALPPSLLSAAGIHYLRRQIAVFCWVPLRCKRGIAGSQIVEARQDFFSCAVWASRTVARPIGDHSLPVVTTLTTPPDLSLASVCHILRRKAPVLLRVPLLRKFRAVLFCKII